MPSDPIFYAVAIPAVMLLGLAKGGFVGVGALAVPLLALVTDPVRAAAITLPVLIVQDIISVWAFRRDFDRSILLTMLPGSAAGIAVGWWFAAVLPETFILGVLGAISAGFGLYRLWIERHAVPALPRNAPAWQGTLLGMGAGFTSQIAHAGQPPFQIYVLPRRLSPARLAGTTALFFAATNWMKVPAYLALGQFDRGALLTAAVLMPAATVATAVGVWLVRRVQPARFYRLTYALMILLGVKLMADALV